MERKQFRFKGDITYSIEAATYRGETWFSAHGGTLKLEGASGIDAAGRTPEKALGLVLGELSAGLLSGAIKLDGVELALPDGVVNELPDGGEA